MENWRKIKRIEKDGYYVSDLGRIKVIKKNGNEKIKIGSLSPSTGYLYLSYKLRCTPLGVHTLVLEAFEEMPEWAECVNHKNGIKTDNRLVNLEWSTRKNNNIHAIATGLNKNIGVTHWNSKTPIETIHKVYEMKKAGYRNCEIARTVNLRMGHVGGIVNGVYWASEYKKFFS